MTDTQLFGFFDHEYGPDGYPKLEAPTGPPITARESFGRHCRLNGLTDPAEIEREWARREAQRAERTKRAGRDE